MQYKFKFIEAIQSAIAPIHNVTLAVGDKITDVFAKVQGLLVWRQSRWAIVAPVTGGVSTTSHVTVLSAVIPANTLTVGSSLVFRMYGTANKVNLVGSTMVFWVKINNVLLFKSTITPGKTMTNVGFAFIGGMSVRTSGSAGTVFGSGHSQVNLKSTAGNDVSVGGTLTYNTTVNNTVTMGIAYSNSNSSNNFTVDIAALQWE